jgi:hypothetical protein
MAVEPSTQRPPIAGSASRPSPLVAALSVYVEPLVSDARVAVVGDGELGLHGRLLELGARTVHLFDPDPERVARVADEVPRSVSVRMLREDFDVRDGAFDLLIIPDLGALPDPSGSIVRLRRVVDPRGAVVAMGRARTAGSDPALFPELAPAAVEYAELYDLFALQFEQVTMTGVLPFSGVLFAELGAGDDLAVSVDTRLADAEPPGVFVVVAAREESALDPYAIIQLGRAPEAGELGVSTVSVGSFGSSAQPKESRDHEIAAAFAAMQLQAQLLGAQLDEHRARLIVVDAVRQEQDARFEQLALERDAAMTRAAELEGLVVAAQQALGVLERRLLTTERGVLERDDQIAALNAELDAAEATPSLSDGDAGREADGEVARLEALAGEALERAERAEASLALRVADLAQVSDAHAMDTRSLEAQLRERARFIVQMEAELARREQLVRELVASLDDARDPAASPSDAPRFEAAPPVSGVPHEEVARLRRKLDELALEVARREGELAARAWRVTELENDKARLTARLATAAPATTPGGSRPSADVERELARARDELDALRQALAQEHAARVAAESGEELARARAELARQAALLQQISDRGTHPDG